MAGGVTDEMGEAEAEEPSSSDCWEGSSEYPLHRRGSYCLLHEREKDQDGSMEKDYIVSSLMGLISSSYSL